MGCVCVVVTLPGPRAQIDGWGGGVRSLKMERMPPWRMGGGRDSTEAVEARSILSGYLAVLEIARIRV